MLMRTDVTGFSRFFKGIYHTLEVQGDNFGVCMMHMTTDI